MILRVAASPEAVTRPSADYARRTRLPVSCSRPYYIDASRDAGSARSSRLELVQRATGLSVSTERAGGKNERSA